MKKASIASLAFIAFSASAAELPKVELDPAVSAKIEKYVGDNAQSITYFKAQHDLVGIGLVTNEYRKNVFYTNSTGDYLLSGVLLDTDTSQNLTALYSSNLDVDLGEIPSNVSSYQSIVQGNGSNQVHAIIDINCGYCHRLWNQMQSILENPNSNVTVNWILVGFMGKQSMEVAQHINGMEDREAALEMLRLAMARQPITTAPEIRIVGKEHTDRVHGFMDTHRFGGVPLVISKINEQWDLNPGLPPQPFFAQLVDKPPVTEHASLSD